MGKFDLVAEAIIAARNETVPVELLLHMWYPLSHSLYSSMSVPHTHTHTHTHTHIGLLWESHQAGELLLAAPMVISISLIRLS